MRIMRKTELAEDWERGRQKSGCVEDSTMKATGILPGNKMERGPFHRMKQTGPQLDQGQNKQVEFKRYKSSK